MTAEGHFLMYDPAEPATERQREYAASKGVTFPAGITAGEMHELLNRRKWRDPPATEGMKRFATRVGVRFTGHVGQRDLFGHIWSACNRWDDPRRSVWFYAWRVARDVTGGTWDDPTDSGIDPDAMNGVVDRLAALADVVRSIKGVGVKSYEFGHGLQVAARSSSAYTEAVVAMRSAGLLPDPLPPPAPSPTDVARAAGPDPYIAKHNLPQGDAA